ncbi:MAG: phenylalanine--tRNA ligase subunit beta [Alphaproteobacteria bacterium GM202ARS2]|nr:phenylalanine--tRNA ligase subunit beta [Alphaproteobacteria bacterium GM202ARS2]
MKLVWSWLQRHLDSDLSVAEVAERLVALGLEVDAVVAARDDLTDVHVVEVERIEAHPNADRLRLCSWRGADDKRGTVVCGAPNVRVGLRSLLAPVGTQLRGWDKPLRAATIRGVVSEGMLCSPQELGVGDDASGIIAIDSDVPLGTPAHTALGLDDVVLDVALTPDRVDCASVRGLARELAAAGCGTLKPLEPLESLLAQGGTGADVTPVAILKEAQGLCGFFSLCRIEGVAARPSPLWVQKALRACDVGCHNVLVDVSNYMMLDLGHPLHVYDAEKVCGAVRVRLSKKNEPFKALDGETYPLDAGLLVVADDNSVLALAGVMGGVASGCSAQTRDVLVECAHFAPSAVAKSGRALGLVTDSRYRFERGVDVSDSLEVLARSCAMLVTLAGGKDKGYSAAGSVTPDKEQAVIACNRETVATYGGVELEEAQVQGILSALGFVADEGGEGGKEGWRVPSWRFDIHESQDLVAEVLRVHGYEHIPAKAFAVPQAQMQARVESVAYGAGVPLLSHAGVTGLCRVAAARGLCQSMSWAFIGLEQARALCVGEPLQLANPLSQEMAVMRPSLLAGLLLACARNQKRGFTRGALFEHGAVWREGAPDKQGYNLAFVRWGAKEERHWRAKGAKEGVDVFDGKADLYQLLGAWMTVKGQGQGRYALPPWYQGSSAEAGKSVPIVAHYGIPTASLCRLFDIEGAVVMGELYLDKLPPPSQRVFASYVPSPYQAVRQDFSFDFARPVRAGALLRVVEAVRQKTGLIREVSIFDVYRDGQEQKMSMGLSVVLQSQEETLRAETIKDVSATLVAAVAKQCGGVLRDG